jgi:predicted transcriptional regulator
VLQCVRGSGNDDSAGRSAHAERLDGIAAALERDRSYVVNEALKAYIGVHQWQIDHIRQGLREADAGKFASETEVTRVITRLRRK